MAKIIRSARREFSCVELTQEGEIVQPTHSFEARAIGMLLKLGDLVVGDTVEVELNENEYSITKLLPRKNTISRTLQRDSKNKILASNVNFLILVFSMEKPEFKRGLLDRYLLRSVQWNIPAIVILNKSDLYNAENKSAQIDWEFEYLRVKNLCQGFFCLSAISPELKSPLPFAQNLLDLEKFIAGNTVIFMGQSGVGKSKLIQSLGHGEIQTKSLALGVVGKGVHTTSWTELHILKKLQLIDSPGIRSLSLNDMSKEDLIGYMPDLEQHVQKCQFHNCLHEENAKGCFFSSKQIDEVTKSRFQSYLRFYSEIQAGKSWEKDDY